ncbi:hypothetical protein D3C86_1797330 [compost metagenome]
MGLCRLVLIFLIRDVIVQIILDFSYEILEVSDIVLSRKVEGIVTIESIRVNTSTRGKTSFQVCKIHSISWCSGSRNI